VKIDEIFGKICLKLCFLDFNLTRCCGIITVISYVNVMVYIKNYYFYGGKYEQNKE